MQELQETQHPCFRLPVNKDIPIWRYTNLAKYLRMLDRRALYFARATKLGDPFEGSSTKQMFEQRAIIKNNKMSPDFSAFKDIPDSYFDNMGGMFRELVRSYLVNCWHMNEQESAAMWKLYSASDEAVCIKSTYRRFRSSLPKCALVGEVEYINYETQSFPTSNGFNFIMHKRLSFAHERELRAIFWEMDGTEDAKSYKAAIDENGLSIEVDLSGLIDEVYISPSASAWFARLIEDVTRRFGFEFQVSQSSLAATPLY